MRNTKPHLRLGILTAFIRRGFEFQALTFSHDVRPSQTLLQKSISTWICPAAFLHLLSVYL